MSQEYTPVSWQDETTSQQGTLINAERLNQMQTAHHYADGFEEVDEIPTEDPGTSYHKIVYCTADAAFYRWDGTQWTKDVDDVTRAELDAEIQRAEHAEGLIQGYLDAHEDNHSNPHQVTKAQVGLGNCDNTADLDKPISTAVQAALDTKADKATTLAGYGITDAYTKTEADTLLADKADKADVYDKTAADTLLAGKVDKLVSSPAGTYKSVTVNDQGQVTAGTNPDTLAGYGITDAYTKSETDTLLAAKADTTALTDGSVTKVGTADLGTDTKPIKLVAGVPTAVGHDLVTTDTEQEITAKKGFTNNAATTSSAAAVKGYYGISNIDMSASFSGNRYAFKDCLVDGNGAIIAGMRAHAASAGQTVNLALISTKTDGTTKALNTFATYDRTNDVWKTTAPTPDSGAGANEVATVGYIDTYPTMVRTANNQDISGEKTFTDLVVNGTYRNKSNGAASDTAGYIRMYKAKSKTVTGVSIVIMAINGKAYSDSDMQNFSIVQFGIRPSVSTGRIAVMIQGTTVTAGAYAITYDTDGYAEIWYRVNVVGRDNHGFTTIKLMESGNVGGADVFEIGDKTFLDTATFNTTYPNAILSA